MSLSLLLASQPISTGFNPHISVNLLRRSVATRSQVDPSALVMQASLTRSVAFGAITTVFSFTIVSDELPYDVVLGPEWARWCVQNCGELFRAFCEFLACQFFY